MKTWLLAAALALAVLACGCVARTAQPIAAPPSSSATTEAIPGGGVRASLVQGGLRFTAEVTSTVTTQYKGSSVIVSLRLTNTGSKSVVWTNLRLGLKGSVVDPKGRASLWWDDMGPRWGAPGYQPPPPFTTTLASGETTSKVIRTGPVPGTYTIEGEYGGDAGPSGTALPIVVVVLSSYHRWGACPLSNNRIKPTRRRWGSLSRKREARLAAYANHVRWTTRGDWVVTESERQSIIDEEDLRLLPIFYWVLGALDGFFSLYGLIYVGYGVFMMVLPSAVSSS
jgi:hypothetical protein